MKTRAFEIAAARPWLILPDSLEDILAIADREMGDPEALSAKLGRPLDNTHSVTKRDGVAIVPITGPIFRYANLFTMISGATSTEILATDIQQAVDDPMIRAIVLDINSPGGEATGINELAQLIYETRAKKPIHAYVGGSGASAAYWIASAATKVIADATAMLGSIGVVMTYTDTRARDAKSDVRKLEFVSSSSPNKRLDPSTEAGRMQVQKIVDDLAGVFISTVARNRNVTTEKVASDFGRGGVLIGHEAVAMGMADALGSLESVIAELAGPASNQVRGSLMTTKAKGPVSVSTTAALQAAFTAGHTAEEISITAVDVEGIKATALAEGIAQGKADATAERAAGVTAERERILGIQAIAMAGFEKEAGEAIASGASVADASVTILKAAKDRGITLGAINKDSPTAARANPAANPASSWDKAVANATKHMPAKR